MERALVIGVPVRFIQVRLSLIDVLHDREGGQEVGGGDIVGDRFLLRQEPYGDFLVVRGREETCVELHRDEKGEKDGRAQREAATRDCAVLGRPLVV